MCFPVSVHRSSSPFRELSARTSSSSWGVGVVQESPGFGNLVCLSTFVAGDLIPCPTSNKVCHRRRWRSQWCPASGPPAQASILSPFPPSPSLSCNPLCSWGSLLPDPALPTLITVTRKCCIPGVGARGGLLPAGPGLSPRGLSVPRLPCLISVFPLDFEPQEGRAGLSWPLLCPQCSSGRRAGAQ